MEKIITVRELKEFLENKNVDDNTFIGINIKSKEKNEKYLGNEDTLIIEYDPVGNYLHLTAELLLSRKL